MTLNLTPDLAAAVQGFLAGGRFKDEQEVLREALAALQFRENVAAIQAGLDDIEAGRVRPWEEVRQELRTKLGLSD